MKKQIYALRLTALLTAALLLTGCDTPDSTQLDSIPENAVPVTTLPDAQMFTEETTEAPTEPPTESNTVSFAAVGDNLIHTRVYETAAEHAAPGETYDFQYCYQYVADRIAAADLAFINQETVICGDDYEVTGSNLNFNSPTELGDALIDVGFDIFNMANNHVLDKGAQGMADCLDYWDSRVQANPDILVLGAYRDYQDMFDYRITEVNGVKIGVLGYTEHTNGYWLPGDSEMEIAYTSDEELIQQQVEELSQMVDCVVVSTHWGVEDSHVVTDEVKTLAQKIVDWGADVIIGTGPHTLESMEYLTRPDGSQGFVFYSLGNFISGQTDNFNMVGGLAQFNIVKQAEGEVTIEDVGLTPVITQYETGQLYDVRVYPYDLYNDALVESHGIPYSPYGTAKSWSWDVIDTIIQENVPQQFQRLTGDGFAVRPYEEPEDSTDAADDADGENLVQEDAA